GPTATARTLPSAAARPRRGTRGRSPAGARRRAPRPRAARPAGRRRRRRGGGRARPRSREQPLLESAELAAELLQPEPHPALDRTDRHLQQLGDLAVRGPAEVRELDRVALIGRQRVDRLADGARLLAACGLDVRTLGRLATLGETLHRGPAALVDGVAAQPVDRAVVDDP